MKIKVTYIATIPDQDLIEAGIALDDVDAISDFYYDNGAEEAYHDYGESFELLP